MLSSAASFAPSGGVPGDHNDDGTVAAADYVVWRDHLNQANVNLPNDSTPAIVDTNDYGVWRSNFGEPDFGSGSSANIPEPTSLALVSRLGLLATAKQLCCYHRAA